MNDFELGKNIMNKILSVALSKCIITTSCVEPCALLNIVDPTLQKHKQLLLTSQLPVFLNSGIVKWLYEYSALPSLRDNSF